MADFPTAIDAMTTAEKDAFVRTLAAAALKWAWQRQDDEARRELEPRNRADARGEDREHHDRTTA
jgi:hypothetical protein